jgi:hypothetical protein
LSRGLVRCWYGESLRFRRAAFFLCGAVLRLVVAPLLAVEATVVVVGNGILMLLCCPLWANWRPKTGEHPNQISFVECPRFMALCNGRRREGSVKAARSVRVHRSEAESLDGFFAPLPGRCLKRGHLTKEEIR